MSEPTPLSALDPAPALAERRRAILRERAAALARPPEPAKSPEGMPVTSFTFAGAEYAVETAFVREVFLLDGLTIIPGAPPFIAGLVNRRGLILTLLDFRHLLGLPKEGIADVHAVVVLRSEDVEAGLLVDTLSGGALLPAREVLPSSGPGGAYVRGITPAGLTVLDAARILSDPLCLLDASGPRAEGDA